MAGRTAQFCENFLASGREWPIIRSAHPGFVLRRLHNHNITDHARMLSATILRAEEVIPARFDCAEPGNCIAAREYVLLHAEFRHEETMDDVLRGHNQLDIASDRDMQLVDLTLPF